MFVPICICALDPGLYKNGFTTFLDKLNKKTYFLHFSLSFSTPRTLMVIFYTSLKQPNQTQIFVHVKIDYLGKLTVSCP